MPALPFADPFEHAEPLFRPPAEAGSLILQVTRGCRHNACRFCGMYKSTRFAVEPPGKLARGLARVGPVLRDEPVKVFLADGDAPAMGFAELLETCRAVTEALPKARRLAAYASPKDLLAFGEGQWRILREARLSLLYVGLESGSDELLSFARKGNTAAEFVAGVRRVRAAGIKVSATAVLGLGGRRFSAAHARSTAEAVDAAAPEYFSLLTLIPGGNEAYLEELDLCTRREILAELREIVAGIGCRTIFRTNHASNFADLGGPLPKDRAPILARLDALLADPRRAGWLDKIPQFAGEMCY